MKLWAMEKMVPLPSNPSASLVLDVVHMWIHGESVKPARQVRRWPPREGSSVLWFALKVKWKSGSVLEEGEKQILLFSSQHLFYEVCVM